MSWQSYNQSLLRYPQHGFSLDLSLMDIEPGYVSALQPQIIKAFADMVAVEAGEIANPDEGRMVGHYWLRNADLAPTEELKKAITEPIAALKHFAEKVHTGGITPPSGGNFQQVLLIGIGGSALGPQLVSEAIGQNARLPLHFFDNTDPAGMDLAARWLARHHGLTVGATAPTWSYEECHDDWGGLMWLLTGVHTESLFGDHVWFSTAAPAECRESWRTVTGISAITNPLEALVAACLHAAGVTE